MSLACRLRRPFVRLAGSLMLLTSVCVQQGLAGDRELGEYLSAECVACHQLSGRYDGIPPIIGWPEESFIEILSLYRDKQRENAVMRNVAAKFTDEEIAALATYFGSLKPTQ